MVEYNFNAVKSSQFTCTVYVRIAVCFLTVRAFNRLLYEYPMVLETILTLRVICPLFLPPTVRCSVALPPPTALTRTSNTGYNSDSHAYLSLPCRVQRS